MEGSEKAKKSLNMQEKGDDLKKGEKEVDSTLKTGRSCSQGVTNVKSSMQGMQVGGSSGKMLQVAPAEKGGGRKKGVYKKKVRPGDEKEVVEATVLVGSKRNEEVADSRHGCGSR